MRAATILLSGALAIIAVGVAVSAAQPDPANSLKSVQSFASIADDKQSRLPIERAHILFIEIVQRPAKIGVVVSAGHAP